MNTESQELQSALVELRDPLTRIQIAASELEDASERAATRSIAEAIADIDLQLEDALVQLQRRTCPTRGDDDVRDSIAEAVRDLAGPLAAGGVELRLGPLPEREILGDGSLVRRMVCRLLLSVRRWLHAEPGTVDLVLRHGGERAALEFLARTSDRRRGPGPADWLGPVRSLAVAEGATIDVSADVSGEVRVVIGFDLAPVNR